MRPLRLSHPATAPRCAAGNLLRLRDGRLAYLDFGMMGQIPTTTRNALMTATLHLVGGVCVCGGVPACGGRPLRKRF